jgi:putative membrane protein
MRISLAGRSGNFNGKISMKNKLTIISQFEIAGALLGLLSFAGVATAQMYGSGTTRPPTQVDTKSTAAEGERDMPGPHTTLNTPTPTAALSANDKTFMMNAAKGGMMEVEWGKWAGQKAQNADVKKFGNRMMTDHSKANNELMSLARKKGVTLTSGKVKAKWTSDKDYMDMMVKDHQQDWAEFQAEAKKGSDPDVKKWAADTSKMIQKHLELGKQTQSKLK